MLKAPDTSLITVRPHIRLITKCLQLTLVPPFPLCLKPPVLALRRRNTHSCYKTQNLSELSGLIL